MPVQTSPSSVQRARGSSGSKNRSAGGRDSGGVGGRNRLLIGVLAGVAILSAGVWVVRLMMSGSRDAIADSPVQKFVVQLQSRLRNDPSEMRWAGVMVTIQGEPGRETGVRIAGTVRGSEDERVLREMVENLSPPVPIDWKLSPARAGR